MSEDETSRKLLSDANVARWYANLGEGSEITADTYLRRLNRFCQEFHTTPEGFAKIDARGAYGLLLDAVTYYRSRGLTGSTIKGYIKVARSWLLHNDIVITKTVRIKGASSTPTLNEEKTPEPYVLHSVWRFCDERQAAAISMMAFTGFRPQVLGNYRGNDGLRLRDLPEMRVDNKPEQITFTAIPTRVLVRQEISKIGRAYEGFLCEEGCMRLEKYLVRRMNAGESLGPESALIADDSGTARNLTTKSICQIVRKAFRHAGLGWRPYILRRYFDTRMGQAAAEAEIGLPDEWVKFWMGHSGDIEATYRLHKKLPDSLLEQMRQAYRRASESMLQTISLHAETPRTRRELRAAALNIVGFSDEEIRHIELDACSTEEMMELVKKKLDIHSEEARRQLVVTAAEAKDYINNRGWRFRGCMGTGEVIIESPT
jgi:integrase